MKKILSLLIVIILAGSSSACGINKAKRYEAEFLQMFDTITKIISYMDSKEEFNKLSVLIYDSLNEYHKLYDIYHDYDGINNIKTINDKAGTEPVKVDRKIIDLLIFSKEAYIRTNGKCNAALGSVLEIWHKYREEGINDPENASLPPEDILKSAMEHTDIDKIIIDEKASTVYLADAEMSLDVGAVAKGYAVEQVCETVKAQGYTSVLISVGGNVKAVGGRNSNVIPWDVGIQNPDTESDKPMLFEVNDIDKSVVTSGNYERYYTVDGVEYNHIINPETIMPATYFRSVTIICSNSGIADELSTAIFCIPYEQGLEIINNIADTEAVWVFPDNSIKYSENFKQYIK